MTEVGEYIQAVGCCGDRWQAVQATAGAVAEQIRADRWQPDLVVGVVRGGVIPAALLAYQLDVANVATVDVAGFPDLPPTLLRQSPARVLLVDDAVDTCRLLHAALRELTAALTGQIRTAALFRTTTSQVQLHYCGGTADTIPAMPWQPNAGETLQQYLTQMRQALRGPAAGVAQAVDAAAAALTAPDLTPRERAAGLAAATAADPRGRNQRWTP